MKGLLPFLVGSVMVATAHAQSEEIHVDLLPMPNTLPLLLFAPDSLAGAMLRPLTVPQPAPELTAAAKSEPATRETAGGAQPSLEIMAQTAPAELTDPDVEAPAVPEPEIPAASEEELAAPPASEEELAAPPTSEEELAAPPTSEEEPEAPPATTVHVIVENVESDSGTVNVAVCDTDFSPDGCPYKTSIPATQGFVEVVFDDVPPGDYAVVGYHDVNDNDEFDKFLSMPREPYALSGDAADALIPEFSDAMLKINQGENFVIIRMKRLGSG
jgi:uncharacterized protein (DUF2141 family)